MALSFVVLAAGRQLCACCCYVFLSCIARKQRHSCIFHCSKHANILQRFALFLVVCVFARDSLQGFISCTAQTHRPSCIFHCSKHANITLRGNVLESSQSKFENLLPVQSAGDHYSSDPVQVQSRRHRACAARGALQQPWPEQLNVCRPRRKGAESVRALLTHP